MDAMKVKRIAIVTGATGGLGREFVRLLLKEKADFTRLHRLIVRIFQVLFQTL